MLSLLVYTLQAKKAPCDIQLYLDPAKCLAAACIAAGSMNTYSSHGPFQTLLRGQTCFKGYRNASCKTSTRKCVVPSCQNSPCNRNLQERAYKSPSAQHVHHQDMVHLSTPSGCILLLDSSHQVVAQILMASCLHGCMHVQFCAD